MARRSQKAKLASRADIVASAAQMFRAQGIADTSVADVMSAAHLTHGGFYRHFASKDDLAVAAVTAAFAAVVADLGAGEADPRAAVARYVATYLSDEHVASAGLGCPIPALGSEAGRIGGAIAGAVADGVAGVTAELARGLPGPAATRHARACQLLAMLVGAVVIARATGGAAIGNEVLAACRARAGVEH